MSIKFLASPAPVALTAVLMASAVQAQTYQVTGGITHASNPADFTQQYDSGVSSTGAQLSQSHSSPDDLGAATFKGTASANSLHAFANATTSASLLSHADTSVFATSTDSVTFSGGADGYVAVLATLYLHDRLAFDEGPAGTNTILSFSAAGNTLYFNQGLMDFDTLNDTAHTSLLQSSMIYYVPNGDALNFQLQLQATAVASFGFDFIRNIPLANSATADAGNTGFLNLKILTPGGSFTSLSGGDYTTLQDGVGGVPEPASWALMIGGFGLVGAVLRRRTAIIGA